ncbi:MAG: polysaccharide biosynthesis C-terminal domain-containing protein [Phaeodactylibacter sp.]|nr:polysaccharide biosynthesis C-terminal domain-containing protein [Phaeodactylibacter sp.]
MSLIKKLAGETAIYGLSSILSRLLNYVILTFYYTREFADGEYGIVSILFTYTAILLVLFTYRMETAFFRFGSTSGQLDQSFSTASLSIFGTTIILATILLLCRAPLATALNFPDHPEYFTYIIFIIAFDALAVIPFARLRLDNRPIRFAWFKTLHILLNLAFIFLFLEGFPWFAEMSGIPPSVFEDGKIGYVFIANLAASLLIFLALLPAYFRITLQFDRVLWRKMIRYAMPLVVVGLAAVINQLIAMPLLENLLPGTLEENRAAVGNYSAASKLAILMSLFTQAFNYAAEPFFFNHAEREDSQLVYAHVGRAFALVGSVVFLGILLYLDLIKLIIGAEMRGALQIVPILLLAYYFLGWYYNFSIWYKLTDKTHFGMYISLSGVAVTLLLNILLVPNPAFGYTGAALAALACYSLMAGLSYWTGRRYYPIPYAMRQMLGYTVGAVLIYYASLGIGHYLQPGLLLGLVINTALLLVYLGTIYWVEKDALREMLSQK